MHKGNCMIRLHNMLIKALFVTFLCINNQTYTVAQWIQNIGTRITIKFTGYMLGMKKVENSPKVSIDDKIDQSHATQKLFLHKFLHRFKESQY